MTFASHDHWDAADAYEAFMGRWSRPLARAFLEWLRPERAVHWLDVGCGTGALTSAICSLCEPASVVACDPAETFLAHARKTVADRRASFVATGTDALPQRDGGFDVVVAGLVLNFVPDPGDAVAAIRDRLRRGGVVAAYVWDYAEGMELLRSFWDEAIAADRSAAAADEGRRFPVCRRAALAALFGAAGLAVVETAALEIPTAFASFDDYWTPFLRATGPAPAWVASLAPTTRASLRDRLVRRLPPGRDGRIRLRARAWAVRGVAA